MYQEQKNSIIHKGISITVFILISVLSMVGCLHMGKEPSPPLQVVPCVDLNRYTGVWYEIARYPNSFQKDCVGSRATYTLKEDGKISVLNECYEKSFDGKIRSAKGKAWVVDKETNAKIKVSFFWFFAGDYWIIDLADDYSYVVVGHPKRKYLWILSRTKDMNAEVYEGILSRLKDKQYDTSKLIKAPQK
jgi:apolipoprotein D and lipocalin family protein